MTKHRAPELEALFHRLRNEFQMAQDRITALESRNILLEKNHKLMEAQDELLVSALDCARSMLRGDPGSLTHQEVHRKLDHALTYDTVVNRMAARQKMGECVREILESSSALPVGQEAFNVYSLAIAAELIPADYKPDWVDQYQKFLAEHG